MDQQARTKFSSAFNDRVIVMLTSQCNLGCGHCLFKLKPQKSPQTLDSSDVKRALGQLESHHEVFLSGGEPTLHPDFVKIAAKLGRFESATVITNGHWIRGEKSMRRFLKKLPKNVAIRLSIDRFHEKKMPDLKEKARVLRETCAKMGRKYEYSLTTSSTREEVRMIREYGLPEGSIVSRSLMKPSEAGTAKSLFVSFDGKLFGSENEFHRKAEPFGTLREFRASLRHGRY
jgi:MoaA/NifB/PqqE/SkfB family radical SAM enzyme